MYELSIVIFKKDEVCSIDDVLLAHKSFEFEQLQDLMNKLEKGKISMEDGIY